MKKAYVIHGCLEDDEYLNEENPSPSNADWFPWLQKQLLLKEYLCQTPEMPSPHRPDYGAWKAAFSCPLDRQTTLVAHSCGGGFVLRLLGETRTRIGRLVLVAPWLDLSRARGAFLDFRLDPSLPERVQDMHLLYALDDPVDEVRQSVSLLRATYPKAVVHTFSSGGHFSAKELGSDHFPALLEIVTK